MLRNSSARTSQKYNLSLPAGVQLTALPDGGYVMLDAAGQSVGRIDSPWAKDATSKDLSTRYTLAGNVLTPTTNTTGATFPVVADPKVSLGLRVYVRYSRAEVKAFKARNALIAGSSLTGTFKDAANRDRCVELKFNYQGIVMEWTSRARGSWCA
ncbi:hypothetical protein [Actinoplanes sp. NPDC051494]|uniref:hypothetical protein n=1 Tax=Actinoplanes sp. NPDC051494 TaxID=3363907 RepID=UPI00378C7949